MRPEAVAQKCSVKQAFLEISQNSQENTCARVFFLIKLQASALQLYLKETLAQVFSCKFCDISRNICCYRAPPVAASVRLTFGSWQLKFLLEFQQILKISSHRRCSIKKMFLKISPNSNENTCFGVSCLIKLQTPTQVFLCEFCKIFKTLSFRQHLCWLLLTKTLNISH